MEKNSKIIHLVGALDHNNLEFLVDKVNEYNDYPKVIYINSHGGEVETMFAFKDIIEANNIPLVCYNEISSCALDLFLISNVNKFVLDGTISVYHKSTVQIPVTSDMKLNYNKKEHKIIFKKFDYENLIDEFLFPLLTEDEIKSYNEGEDIFLGQDIIINAVINSYKYFSKK